MSVRFAQHADRLIRDGVDQLAWDSYTILFFFRIREDTGNYQCLVSLEENSVDSWHVFETDPAFRLWSFLGNPVQLDTHVDVALDEWYVAAFVHTATQVKSYVRRVVDPDFTTASTPDTNARTFNRLVVASDFAAETFDGDVVGGRMWGLELTPEEIAAEADSLIPIRTADLFASYYLFDVAGKLDDSSGNGRALSPADVGTWTTEDNPPVDAFTGTLDSILPGFSSDIQASGGYLVTLDSMLPGFSSDMQAARGVAGALASQLPGFSSDVVGARGVACALASELPGFASSIIASGPIVTMHPTATLELERGPSATVKAAAGPSATMARDAGPTATLGPA